MALATYTEVLQQASSHEVRHENLLEGIAATTQLGLLSTVKQADVVGATSIQNVTQNDTTHYSQ